MRSPDFVFSGFPMVSDGILGNIEEVNLLNRTTQPHRRRLQSIGRGKGYVSKRSRFLHKNIRGNLR